MGKWDCPECHEPCKGPKEHVNHVVKKHLVEEKLVESPPRVEERNQPLSEADENSSIAVQSHNAQLSCLYPGCKKAPQRKHRKRHYLKC